MPTGAFDLIITLDEGIKKIEFCCRAMDRILSFRSWVIEHYGKGRGIRLHFGEGENQTGMTLFYCPSCGEKIKFVNESGNELIDTLPTY